MFAVGNSQPARLEGDEARAVHIFMGSNSHADVLIHRKLIVNKRLICSRQNKVTKRNSYTVAYMDPQPPHPVRYGTVEKLVTLCHTESVILAIVKPLHVVGCQLGLTFPPELQQYSQILLSDFVSICGSSRVVAVSVESACFKCFDISTEGYRGLTPLIDEPEKDL